MLAKTVLLVSPRPSLASALAQSVGRLGYQVIVANTFEEARQWWCEGPDLLITELKLGAYNGLHLALRALAIRTPAIVIADKSFEKEIEQMGAVWLPEDTAVTGELRVVASSLMDTATAGQAPCFAHVPVTGVAVH